MRILYVHSTLVPPPVDRQADRFWLLSGELGGDVLQPVWFERPEQVEEMFGPNSYPVYTVGNFRYHWHLGSVRRGVRQRLATFAFYIRKGVALHAERPFQCIVAYSHMTTGLIAGVVKLLTGARLIIEIVTNPALVYLAERARPGPRERVRKLYSDICLYLSVFLADRVHCLYPTQLTSYFLLRNKPKSVFHDFVPVSMIGRDSENPSREVYVLLVGAPWYLKGADLLVDAFLGLASNFPNVKLKLLGHFPDGAELQALTMGSPQIEILRARPHQEALKIIQAATIMVLPSRCEGLPRVVIEAMAAGVPVIGSDVAGIPVLVRHGENGLVFSKNDVDDLRRQLALLLADDGLRRRMGDAGYARAHAEFNEKTYVREFAAMIAATVDRI